MKKMKLAGIIFTLGLIAISMGSFVNITGLTIANNFFVYNSYYLLIGLVLIFLSLVIMGSKQSLDAIIILGSPFPQLIKKRAKKAVKYGSETVFIASGGRTPSLPVKYKHEAHMIYEKLRELGVKPHEIKIEKNSQNTLDNIINSLEKIKGNKIGIVSNPQQLNRVEKIVTEAKAKNLIRENIEIYRIETQASWGEKLYESLAKLATKYQLKKLDKDYITRSSFLKKAVNYIFKRIV